MSTTPPKSDTRPPAFRPSPTRTISLGATQQYKTRAASQPAGERLPVPHAHPHASPAVNGNGNFGVIGGTRSTGRFGNALAGMGPVTRASSFSAGERMPQERNLSLARTLSSHTEEFVPSRSQSTSPFPTFSPTSTPSTSPAAIRQQPLPHSPPKAAQNISRSRSQSLAAGVRPSFIDRGYFTPMSSLDSSPFVKLDTWGSSDASNMSPFTRGLTNLANTQELPRSRLQQDTTYTSARAAWADSNTQSALTSSVAKALGGYQPPHTGSAATFAETTGSEGRSGASSRRHSVSVVGGPGGRREWFNEGGMGITPYSPNRGLYGLENDLGNALNLDIERENAQGLYGNEFDGPFGGFGKGRGPSPQAPQVERTPDPRRPSQYAPEPPNFGRPRTQNAPPLGPSLGVSLPRNISQPSQQGPGPIGSPPANSFMQQPTFMPFPPGSARPPYQAPAPPNQGVRPPAGAVGSGYGFYQPGQPPVRPTPSQQFAPPNNNFRAEHSPPNMPASTPAPQASQPQAPTSPSFSSLSLSDLGKGLPLSSLPASTPLYIVTFKAGRRDVYYCPDPTLLISNGDRVIVEADRGSDLGVVVADQVTPVDVREWQERMATKALLSGAREHQPPGMGMDGAPPQGQGPQGPGGHQRMPSLPQGQGRNQPGLLLHGMELASLSLDDLLSGVGPGGQMEVAGGATAVRGPLAKEIAPKRIFAKSSQGVEEQQRMREKAQDEYDAMMIGREKVLQRGLPMQIVDAEYQWDRRKLTFYFKADKRVDFRDLTKECFRIFKSRIWMSMVSKDDPRA
ncbi:hypothetical protein L202_04349 [Cryptococcus amylolentus CBS 6039]|uniref:PSP1 C-terminal domain-containing protein n=1 Tax=Cryptococcus amylolentus CBS 6039 TaxID=1295533 RepID=A0A1E3HSY8_9TREE|nr:hypothetical protein L202_04349 [Cryptococcus amylolentus CBS 6039]ODN78796.1 hypothetical protein L202_04349 [Cryptococcus amylolentus CBS 6039]